MLSPLGARLFQRIEVHVGFSALSKTDPTKVYPPEMDRGWFSSSFELVLVTQLFALEAIYLDDRHIDVNGLKIKVRLRSEAVVKIDRGHFFSVPQTEHWLRNDTQTMHYPMFLPAALKCKVPHDTKLRFGD